MQTPVHLTLLVDHSLLSYCKQHSTCTPEANIAGDEQFRAHQCCLLLLCFQAQTASHLGLSAVSAPSSLQSHSPLHTTFSLCLQRHPCPQTCACQNAPVAGKPARTSSSSVWSYKSEAVILKLTLRVKIRSKSQIYVDFDHNGNLPRAGFECRYDNLLGERRWGPGGATWNADTAQPTR